MDNFFSRFRSTEGRKDRRQAFEKGKGGGLSDPLLDTREWSVSFTYPSDISASVANRSSIETALIYDDYPSYPTYGEATDDVTLHEVDGVMAMNKSSRSGVSLVRRVSGSFRSLKKGLTRMAKRKYPEQSSRDGTLDQNDEESISTTECSNCEHDVKRRKTVIPRLRKKFLLWAKSVRRSAMKSCKQENPTGDSAVSEVRTTRTRSKACAKFLPLECDSVSFDVGLLF